MRRGNLGWEGRELLIPMAISVTHWRHPAYVRTAAARAQPLIDDALREAARADWHADEPTDFATLFSRSQVRTRDSVLRWRVDSVTVQMRRAIPDEPVIPHG